MAMLVDEVADAVDRLTAAGVDATGDPSWAETHRPCVLVAPPSVDFTSRELTHRVICLAGHDSPTLDAFGQLAELVDQVDAALPVVRAEPTTYPLTTRSGAVPAYLLTVTATTP